MPCCRLTGFFLGGHDRDLYIKCTSPEFANLPMIDIMQGGCIMTCSHFEKAAGRELSKKCASWLLLSCTAGSCTTSLIISHLGDEYTGPDCNLVDGI